MEYSEQVLDRSTGEMTTISAGEWITITELGELRAVSARRVRTILRKMDFLYVSGGQVHNRHRLTPWVIQRGFGKHIPMKKPAIKFPFDVIGPLGREWIDERWLDAVAKVDAQEVRREIVQAREALDAFRSTRLHPLNVQGQALWLCDHFSDLSHTEMASILDVTQQVVSRYVGIRSGQRKAARASIRQTLPDGSLVLRSCEIGDSL